MFDKLHILNHPSPYIKGRHVCHCLEYNVVGTGDTPEDAFIEMLEALSAMVKHIKSEEAKGTKVNVRAPEKYWDEYREKDRGDEGNVV